MVDHEDARKDRLYEEAVRVYTDHYVMEPVAGARQADRRFSRIKAGDEPSVVLMDTNGVPLGTVVWFDGKATFEPPTRITVVDHFQGLRPDKE
jgi:hypothetical protein